MYLGMSELAVDSTGFRGTNQGSKLCSDGWLYGNLVADAEFGSSEFKGKCTGYRTEDYGNIRPANSHWWSSSEYDDENVWIRHVYYNYVRINRIYLDKKYGCAVRFVRD